MRIYNKKTFAFGVVSTALGLLNLFTSIWRGFDLGSFILILLLFFFGIGSILRSLSHKFAVEDKLDELDERNQYVELKSRSKSFQVTRDVCFGLMLLFLVLGKTAENNVFMGIGIGLAFAFSVSLFAEIMTFVYYERRL